MPLEMYAFTQQEYNTAAQVIEETPLIPEWLPKTWISDVDRFAKGLHPLNTKTVRKAAQPSRSVQRQSSNKVASPMKSKPNSLAPSKQSSSTNTGRAASQISHPSLL